jgi:hypothetical protein
MPKVAFDLAEIAKEFMAAYAGWYQRARIAEVEEQLTAERTAKEANYLAGGRRFQKLTTAALKRKWLKTLKRDVEADRRRYAELDDLGAELALRRITKIDLPADVRKLMNSMPRDAAVSDAS